MRPPCAISDPYGTHEPVLRALAPISKNVLELGGGMYSTPLFLENPLLKRLVTVEDDPDWAAKIRSEHPLHLLITESAIDYVNASHLAFDLILVDNATSSGERAKTIRTVANRKPRAVVVVHDYEQFLYRDAAQFDNKWVYNQAEPWTGVCWNEDCRYRSERIHRLLSGL
jgi:hypothetical protein